MEETLRIKSCFLIMIVTTLIIFLPIPALSTQAPPEQGAQPEEPPSTHDQTPPEQGPPAPEQSQPTQRPGHAHGPDQGHEPEQASVIGQPPMPRAHRPTYLNNMCDDLSVQAITTSDITSRSTKAADGDISTSWTSNKVNPWIQLDLGIPKFICSIDVAWYNGNIKSYHFTILTSDGRTIFSPTHSDRSSGTTSSYETYPISYGPVKHLRIRIDGNSIFKTLVGIKEIHIRGY